MSEETPANDQERDEPPRAGERLALARRDQEISIRDIAKELHLDENKVQALEQNQFDTLGAPVFAKGHLRKYAEIVGVPVDDILTDYYQMNRAVGAPPVVGPARKVQREIDLTRYILPAFAVLVAAGVFIWWLQAGSPMPSVGGSNDVPGSAIELEPPVREIPVQAPAVTEPSLMPAVETPETADTETADAPSAEPAPAAPQPAPEPVATPTGPQVSLSMTFSGDCWTEVTDAAGSRLFFDLGRTGRTVSISGTAPLRVLFGSYANVSLAVNGDDYPIPGSAVRGETARFSINAR